MRAIFALLLLASIQSMRFDSGMTVIKSKSHNDLESLMESFGFHSLLKSLPTVINHNKTSKKSLRMPKVNPFSTTSEDKCECPCQCEVPGCECIEPCPCKYRACLKKWWAKGNAVGKFWGELLWVGDDEKAAKLLPCMAAIFKKANECIKNPDL